MKSKFFEVSIKSCREHLDGATERGDAYLIMRFTIELRNLEMQYNIWRESTKHI